MLKELALKENWRDYFLNRKGYVVSTETEVNCRKTSANIDKCEGKTDKIFPR